MIKAIHTNSTGTTFRMTLAEDGAPLDLTGATLELIFKRPDGTGFPVDAGPYGDPEDGIVEYVGEDGDFDDIGSWRWQAHVVKSGEEWYSDCADFEVLPNLPTT